MQNSNDVLYIKGLPWKQKLIVWWVLSDQNEWGILHLESPIDVQYILKR